MQKDYFEILDRKAKDAFAEKGESQYTNDFSQEISQKDS